MGTVLSVAGESTAKVEVMGFLEFMFSKPEPISIGEEWILPACDPWAVPETVVVTDVAGKWVRIRHKAGVGQWAVEVDVFKRVYRKKQ